METDLFQSCGHWWVFQICWHVYHQYDFGTDHLVISKCRVVSCVVRRGCLLWPVCSLAQTVSLCPASFCTPRRNLPVTLGFLDFLLLYSSPLWWKGYLFWVLVLEGLAGTSRTKEKLQGYGRRAADTLKSNPNLTRWQRTNWRQLIPKKFSHCCEGSKPHNRLPKLLIRPRDWEFPGSLKDNGIWL